MRTPLVLLGAGLVLAAGVATGVATMNDDAKVRALKATDRQMTITHRIAVGAMARATAAAAGPTALYTEVDSGPISNTVPIAALNVQPGQDYLLNASLVLQGNGEFNCFTADADGTRGPVMFQQVAGVESVTLTGVFPGPSQTIGLFCTALGAAGAQIQSGQLSLTEVSAQQQ